MNRTDIEWTDWSCTPLKMQMPDGALVNSCAKVSDGCARCYAESYVRRFWKKAWGPFPGYTPALLRIGKPFLVEKELQAVLRLSERIAAGKADPAENKIFWNDMTDEFLEFWPDEFRDRLNAVRALTPNLVHQVLTKRAEALKEYFLTPGRYRQVEDASEAFDTPASKHLAVTAGYDQTRTRADISIPWPLPNVWLGVSVENRKHGLPRIEHLRQTPAALRFLSVEPLLEEVNLHDALWAFDPDVSSEMGAELETPRGDIGWVIVGGESGHGARPCDLAWIRSVISQCKAAGVPCFTKQIGSHPYVDHSPEPAASIARKHGVGPLVAEFLAIRDKKGGTMEEWPADLRVRQWPQTREVVPSPST